MLIEIAVLALCVILLLGGFGMRTLKVFRISPAFALAMLFLGLIFVWFPPLTRANTYVFWDGVYIILTAVFFWLMLGDWRKKAIHLMSIALIAGVLVAYRYFSAQSVVLSVWLLPLTACIATFLLSYGYTGAYISGVLGVALADFLLSALPVFGSAAYRVGADAYVMLLAALGAMLLKLFLSKLSARAYAVKNFDSKFEASVED